MREYVNKGIMTSCINKVGKCRTAFNSGASDLKLIDGNQLLHIISNRCTMDVQIMLTKFSILSSVIARQVFCSYIHFNASIKRRGLGISQDSS